MADEVKSEREQVVSVELPAPPGWKKKFTPKKAGTPKRNEIVFISPIGEEIRTKTQLDLYLRSQLGGPSASEFDWGFGDAPRRSARLSEKVKAMEALEEEPPKKQKRITSSKKDNKQKIDADDAQAEKETRNSDNTAAEVPESDENSDMKDAEDSSMKVNPSQMNRGKPSISKKKTKQKTHVDAQVENNPPESNAIESQSLECKEDATDTKYFAETIAEDNIKMDLNDGQGKNDVDAAAEDEALERVEVMHAVDGLEDADLKDAVHGSVHVEEATCAKVLKEDISILDSNEGTKQENDDASAQVETSTQAIGSVEDAAMKDGEDCSVVVIELTAANEANREDSSKADLIEVTIQEMEGAEEAEIEDEVLETEVVVMQAAQEYVFGSVEKKVDVFKEDDFKVDSNEGTKPEESNVEAEAEAEAEDEVILESDNIFNAVMKGNVDGSVEVSGINAIAEENSNVHSYERSEKEKDDTGTEEDYKANVEDADMIKDAEGGSVIVIEEEAAANAILEDSSAKVNSNGMPADEDEANKTNLQQDYAVSPNRKEENEEQIKDAAVIISIPEAEEKNGIDSRVPPCEAGPYKENIYIEGAEDDETLLSDNHKGEQVSPSKAISSANHVDLPSPQKASAIV